MRIFTFRQDVKQSPLHLPPTLNHTSCHMVPQRHLSLIQPHIPFMGLILPSWQCLYRGAWCVILILSQKTSLILYKQHFRSCSGAFDSLTVFHIRFAQGAHIKINVQMEHCQQWKALEQRQKTSSFYPHAPCRLWGRVVQWWGCVSASSPLLALPPCAQASDAVQSLLVCKREIDWWSQLRNFLKETIRNWQLLRGPEWFDWLLFVASPTWEVEHLYSWVEIQ